MKKLILLIFFVTGLHIAVLAQCDPQFAVGPTYTGTSVVSGTPTILVGETGTLNFGFGVGTDAGCNAAAGNTAGGIIITLSFAPSYGPQSAADISGPYASYFDWVYDAAGTSLFGFQNAPIPVGPPANFAVQVRGNAVTPGTIAPPTSLNWTSDLNPPPTNTSTGNDIRTVGLNVDAALPVTLTSFTARKEGKIANLNWSTTAETNSDRFEIEHSLNGQNWNKIGVLKSNGESKTLLSYTYSDRNPGEGENLYRLRMVDNDGTFAYSRIQSVKFEGLNRDLSVYPNPVTDKISLRDFSTITEVVINDLNGRTVHLSGTSANGQINVKNLVPGTYIVKITRSDGGISSQKIVISR